MTTLTTAETAAYLRRRRVSWWLNEAVDQGAHFFIATFTVWLATVFGAVMTPSSGMLLGFALGALREATEGGNVISDGSITDLGFWALGGFAGGVL